MRRFLVTFSTILLALLLVGCGDSQAEEELATKIVTEPRPTTTQIYEPEPTHTPQPSPTVAPVPTATASPTATKIISAPPSEEEVENTRVLPDYFHPHPALKPVEEWSVENDTLFLTPVYPTSVPLPVFIEDRFPARVSGVAYSKENAAFLVAEEVASSDAELVITSSNGDKGDRVFQSWVISADGTERRLLFQSDRYWYMEWVNTHQLIAFAICYGDGPFGDGIHLIDTTKKTVITLIADFGGCEGEVRPDFSSDGRYMFYGGKLFDLETGQATPICDARSSAWSKDGQWLYLACGTTEASDQLFRFNLLTKKTEQLTNLDEFSFQAARMQLSPSENQLIIEWHHGGLNPSGNFGFWVIDLEQLLDP